MKGKISFRLVSALVIVRDIT